MQARRLPFQDYQYAFAAHIRDPRANPRPAGVPPRRMRVYNELLFNNLEGFLLACFPVSRAVLGARRWRKLVRAFFAGHRCRTPFFRQIPEEFVEWLRGARAGHPEDPPFLPDLAHYEWVELALDVSPLEPDCADIDRAGDLLAGRPALNPVAMLLTYPYAVHRIGSRFRPAAPDPAAYPSARVPRSAGPHPLPRAQCSQRPAGCHAAPRLPHGRPRHWKRSSASSTTPTRQRSCKAGGRSWTACVAKRRYWERGGETVLRLSSVLESARAAQPVSELGSLPEAAVRSGEVAPLC